MDVRERRPMVSNRDLDPGQPGPGSTPADVLLNGDDVTSQVRAQRESAS